MTVSVSRRRVLGGCLAAAAGAAITSGRSAEGIEPVVRTGGPFFKYSLAAYSYRDLLTGAAPKLTMEDFVRECARMGLEGTELTSYYFPKDVSPDYLRRIKKLCFESGLDVSGTAVGNDFGHPAGEKRAEQIAMVKRWIEYAEILGAPVIRIFAGHVPKGDDPRAAHGRMVEAMEECCDHAGKHGVFLALENHGGPTATADGLLEFVRAVKSPWFGVNLDAGNFRSDDVYGDLAKIAPYAINAQLKVTYPSADGTKRPLDFGRLARVMRDANYRGYIVLEFEEPGDPRQECPRLLADIRKAFA